MSQDTRNKVYATVSGVLGILLVLGVIDKATSDRGLDLTNTVLLLVPAVLGLAGNLLAFFKSLRSRVTTLNVPAAQVVATLLTNGSTVAGDAHPAPTGSIVDPSTVSPGPVAPDVPPAPATQP